MDKLKKNNIFNSNNYKPRLPPSNKILLSYLEIVNEYIVYTIENIKIKDEMLNSIIYRGLKILKHIFLILLLYTKNLNLVLYHGKKAYLYFVEFIDQIGEDNHSYLQLTSKDAVLFVYKKTIFEINNEYKSKMELSNEQKEELRTIGIILNSFNEIIYKIIKKDKKDYKNNIELSIQINNKILNLKKKKKNFKELNKFILYLSEQDIDNKKYSNLILKFINFFSKKNLKLPINNSTSLFEKEITINDIKELFTTN